MSRFKYILGTRHGELENPSGLVYNRDVVNVGRVMHISPEGRQQMRDLARSITLSGLNLAKIRSSPEIRALECVNVLHQQLGVADLGIYEELTDNFAPGPCREGMSIAQYEALGGAVYERWDDHEKPEAIIQRMKRAFYMLAGELEIGEAGILLSHGDPLAWLINYLIGFIPEPWELRKSNYPTKGSATLFVLSPTHEILKIDAFFAPEVNRVY